ncbi:MAG: hypothetical protein BMS9Abin15_0993 [Gammaproteobacteria bacterium]|nr:MAG: hypothetical protein BMS9Abin15_0993 [Gammaproteobacteria bacterium]
MTLDKAREMLEVQVSMGSGYNRNSARLILAEVQREHGQSAVDQLIRELDLETAFGLKPGTDFSRVAPQ